MVLSATFNNISVILWRSVLLVEETRVPGENHWPVASCWKNYHIMLYRVHLVWTGFELTTLVVISTDCIGSYRSNYQHTIMSAPMTLGTNHLTFREAIFFLPSQNFFYIMQTSDFIYIKKLVNIVPILSPFFVVNCRVTLYIFASLRTIYVCL